LQAIGEARLRLTGQAFYQRFHLPIAGIDANGSSTPFTNRSGGIQTFGAEGEARLELSRRSSLFLNVSFFRGEDLALPVTARLLTDVPQARFNAGVSLPLGRWLTCDVVFVWASERRGTARSPLELLRRYTLPGHAIVTAQIRTERLLEFLELSVTGQNVFSQEYADDAPRQDRMPHGVPREGVMVFGTARVFF
jgi:outer membrane receptor for ferrienterochelin and colicins